MGEDLLIQLLLREEAGLPTLGTEHQGDPCASSQDLGRKPLGSGYTHTIDLTRQAFISLGKIQFANQDLRAVERDPNEDASAFPSSFRFSKVSWRELHTGEHLSQDP
jgi:hypothetical protein